MRNTYCFALAIVLASIATARADNIIPAAYHGAWCNISTDLGAPEQKFKQCPEINGEQDLKITARAMTNDEALCSILSIKPERKSIVVQSRCRVPPNKSNTVTERLQLNGNTLTITYLD
jgi:hypothetical protein